MADYPVKWFTSNMPGAPAWNPSNPGEFVAFLHALLVTGFNTTTVDTLTYDAVEGEGIIEITGGHGFLKHQIIEIAGADQAGYNGQWRVSSVTSTLVRFAMDVAPSENGTGTMTVKTPGAGWTRPYISGDTYRAAFKPDNADGSDTWLYVDNRDTEFVEESYSTNGTTYPHIFIRGCAHISDIDTRTGDFGGDHLGFYAPGTDPVVWTCVLDGRSLYISQSDSQDARHSTIAFGDLVSSRRPDYSDAFLILTDSAQTSVSNSNHSKIGKMNPVLTDNWKRLSVGASLADLNAYMQFHSITQSLGYFAGEEPLDFPGVDGNLVINDKILVHSGRQLIGWMPGFKEPLHDKPLPHRTVFKHGGRLHMAVHCEYTSSTSLHSMMVLDLEGPWQ